MGRTAEEMEDVTLLGNKNVKYSMDYAPEMLQTFINNIRTMIILSSSIVRNLPAYVRSRDSRILQPYIYPMFRM